MTTISGTKSDAPFRAPVMLGTCLFVAIAGFFLWQEHRAHVLGILPYLLLAACPIIHLLMHGRHGSHHRHHHEHDQEGERR